MQSHDDEMLDALEDEMDEWEWNYFYEPYDSEAEKQEWLRYEAEQFYQQEFPDDQ